MIIQLFTNGKMLLGSDGLLNVDGRFNSQSIRQAVQDRNKRYIKNFPHKVSDSYATFKGGQIRNGINNIIKL